MQSLLSVTKHLDLIVEVGFLPHRLSQSQNSGQLVLKAMNLICLPKMRITRTNQFNMQASPIRMQEPCLVSVLQILRKYWQRSKSACALRALTAMARLQLVQ